jgi:hypothetical protein
MDLTRLRPFLVYTGSKKLGGYEFIDSLKT